MLPEPLSGERSQAGFQRRWPELCHPDVRNLAWLLDAAVLLNPEHPRWNGQLARLTAIEPGTAAWLHTLDQAPALLLEFLAVHPHTRLGHYAENLLAFYFQWRGWLVAHGVQVRSHTTIGEFDFLLNTDAGFEHWEFACKFYLLVAPGSRLADFVGPNLKDNLEDKSYKIMQAQLSLGQHPDAQKYLPAPLLAARALLKGWLFYPTADTLSLAEIAPDHCRGVWCRVDELAALVGAHGAVLSRLNWLAPAKVSTALSGATLEAQLTRQFMADDRPVLVASLAVQGDWLIETERIFVVPNNWNVGRNSAAY